MSEPLTSSPLSIEEWPINQPIPYARNARKIPQSAIDKVAASIHEFGFRQPIVVDKQRVILAGHTRLLAAQKLGLEHVPVHVAMNLTVAQAKAFRLADNRTNQESTWDNELLSLELADLKVNDFDVGLTGFDPDELIAIDTAANSTTEGLTEEDSVPEPPKHPITALGDLWILGNHRLLCGDSTSIDAVEQVMNGQKADMVFTDPPYNIASENKVVAANVSTSMQKLAMSEWDKNFDITETLASLFPALAADVTVYICTSHHLAADIWGWMKQWAAHYNWCVWSKPNPMPSLMKRHWTWNSELICYATRGKHTFNFPDNGHALSVWEFTKNNENTGHPTEKPVKLPVHAIEHSSTQGDTVLDLFGGSGSTLIACEKTARSARLMELDPQYCDVIVTRWQDFTGKIAVLEANGRTFNDLANERQPRCARARSKPAKQENSCLDGT